MTPEQATALRKPFEPNQIGILPKPYAKDSPKGNCKDCGGYHGLPAVHLDFVGHAGVTARLLNIDPAWSWEPLALDEQGLPAYDRAGGLWIKLTVLGVTRLGYGDGPDPKQRIGDALRNAAMRFGVALDLWSKQELEYVDPNGGGDDAPTPPPNGSTPAAPAPPPISPAPGEPEAPGHPDGLPSPEANVGEFRARVIDLMSKPRKDALIGFARLKAEIAKAGLSGAQTTTPMGRDISLGGLCDEALDFVSKKEQGNAHADAAAGEQIQVPA